MKKILPAIFLLLLLQSLSGCMFITPKTYANDDIDPDMRTEMAAMNKKLFTYIMNKNIKGVKSMISKKLLDSVGKKIDTLVTSMADAYHATNYRAISVYYTKNNYFSAPNDYKVNDNLTSFNVVFRPITSDSYTSVLATENLPINCCMLFVYGKDNGTWKINILEFGAYDVLGKTAPEYYMEATERYRQGDTIDAANLIITAAQVGNPAGKYGNFNNLDDMKDFYQSTVQEANVRYHFPITVSRIKTAPQIFGIGIQLVEGMPQRGIYPQVKYLTKINLKDTVALKAENMAMQKIIGSMFKGIDQNKAYILYRAYNKLPNDSVKVDHYGFAQHLN